MKSRNGNWMAERFDGEAFYAALDAVRSSRGLTWKQVAAEAKINASTLSRIGQGKKPDVDGLAALLAWSNLNAETFIPEAKQQDVEPLAQIAALIRMDQSLSYNNARVLEDIVTSTYKRLRDT
jgi:transcriptional regulator with XRE-family HTH domain